MVTGIVQSRLRTLFARLSRVCQNAQTVKMMPQIKYQRIRLGILALLLAMSSYCWAQSNTLTVYNTSGSALTSQVIEFNRATVQGEVASGSGLRPIVGGTPIADGSWQDQHCQRPNSWPADTSRRIGKVSYVAPTFASGGNEAVTFQTGTCNTTGMTVAQIITALGSNDPQLVITPAGPTNSAAAVTIKLIDMLNGLAVADGQIEFLDKGPVATEVLVGRGDRTYDRGWYYDGTNMSSDGSHTSYTGTQTCTNNTKTVKCAHLHFIWDVRAYADGTVKVGWSIENDWATIVTDQNISIDYKSDASTTVWSSASYIGNSGGVSLFASQHRIFKEFWLGTHKDFRVDHNYAYLIKTKLLPCYDNISGAPCDNSGATVTASPTSATDNNDGVISYTDWTATAKGEAGETFSTMQFPDAYALAGGNKDWNILKRPDLQVIYNCHGAAVGTANGPCPKAWQEVFGLAGTNDSSLTANNVAGGGGTSHLTENVNYHNREDQEGNGFYCSSYDYLVTPNGTPATSATGCSGTAIGRPLSKHNYPQSSPDGTHGGWVLGGAGFSGASHSAGGWGPDLLHQQQYEYFPWLIDGLWFYEDELYQNASWVIQYVGYSAGDGYFVWSQTPPRQMAGTWAAIARAAVIAPDGSPERKYYTAAMESNIAIMKGAAVDQPSCSGYAIGTATRTKFGFCDLSYGAMGLAQTLHAFTVGQCVTGSELYTAGFGAQATAVTSANPAAITLSSLNTSSDTTQIDGYPVSIFGATGGWAGLNFTVFAGKNATRVDATHITVPINSSGFSQSPTGTIYVMGGQVDWSAARDFDQNFMASLATTSLGHVCELGFTSGCTLLAEMGKGLVEPVLDTGNASGVTNNPYAHVQSYERGIRGNNSCTYGTPDTNNAFATSWSAVTKLYVPYYQTTSTFTPGGTPCDNQTCTNHNYPSLFRQALSFTTGVTGGCSQGSCLGTAAWTWANTHVPFYDLTVTGSATASGDHQVEMATVPRTSSSPTVSSCTISPSSATISTGGTQAYTSVITWSDASTTDGTATLSLSSGTPSVATVSGQTATGVSAGSSTITGTNTVSCGTSALTVNATATGSGASTGVFTGVRH